MKSIHSLEAESILPRLLEKNKSVESNFKPSSSFLPPQMPARSTEENDSDSLVPSENHESSYEDTKSALNDKLMALLLCRLYGDSLLESEGDHKGENGNDLLDPASRQQFLDLYDLLKNQLPDDLLYSSLQNYLFDEEELNDEESWNGENTEDDVSSTESVPFQGENVSLPTTHANELFDIGDSDLVSLFKKIHEMPKREEDPTAEKNGVDENDTTTPVGKESSNRRKIEGERERGCVMRRGEGNATADAGRQRNESKRIEVVVPCLVCDKHVYPFGVRSPSAHLIHLVSWP